MSIQEIAATSHWKTEALEPLALLVADYLGTLEPSITIGTTDLLAKLGWSHDMGRDVFAHLGNARKRGLLEGHFTAGKPTYGTFGKPSIRWHAARVERKREMTKEERIAWIKENDPESYAAMTKR